uniref:Uncharacterized protein n=1 Tax=Arion vulgaris TaxID=1028688 RepID=A0A0B6Z2Y6_9EUPU
MTVDWTCPQDEKRKTDKIYNVVDSERTPQKMEGLGAHGKELLKRAHRHA